MKNNIWTVRFLNALNFNLGYLNWIVIPIKLVLFTLLSLLSKMFEPYSRVKKFILPENIESKLYQKKSIFEKRLNEFSYKGFITCELYGDMPDGKNHYTSDWLLWNSVFTAGMIDGQSIRADDYVNQLIENWIDDEGHVRRGWLWKDDGEKNYEYRISLDQLCGLVYVLSKCDIVDVTKENQIKFVRMVDKFIADGYVFKTPDKSDEFVTSCKVGIFSIGYHVGILMSLLHLAHIISKDDKYLNLYNKYKRHGAFLACLIPIPNVFELVRGFNYNKTFLSLSAITKLSGNLLSMFGMKWTWWITRTQYNPFWTFLTEQFYHLPRIDYDVALYQLSTMSEMNYNDFTLFQPEKNFEFNGEKIDVCWTGSYMLPPEYSKKSGDAFMCQGTWRNMKYFGDKHPSDFRSNRKFNMVTFLAPYYLWKSK